MSKTHLIFCVSVLLIGLLGSCEEEPKKGCTDSAALNFDSEAEEDDGTCDYALTACFTVSNPFATEDQPVFFASGCSRKAQNYLWEFGDGGTSQSASPEYSYSSPGTYTVRLTVSDGTSFDNEEKTIVVSSMYSRVRITGVSVTKFPWYDTNGGHWDPYFESGSGGVNSGPEMFIRLEDQGGNMIGSTGNPLVVNGITPPDNMNQLTWSSNIEVTDLNQSLLLWFYDDDAGQEQGMHFYGAFKFIDGDFQNYPSSVTLQKSVQMGSSTATITFSMNLDWIE